MATHTSTKPTSANGDARGPLSNTAGAMPAPPPVNRKKQKRRQKQAARLAGETSDVQATNGAASPIDDRPSNDPDVDSADLNHANGDNVYRNGNPSTQNHTNGPASSIDRDDLDHSRSGSKSKKKKNKKGRSGSHTHADGSSTPLSTPSASFSHPPSSHSLPYHNRFSSKSGKESNIWNQSSLEERENIRTFWFELGEEERRQLVKVEKDAVLKKMKEQQKHSCSCSVCGRKRTAIEEELEVLYDAYYEELEQYANNNQGSFEEGAPIIPPPRLYQPPLRSPGQHTRTHGQYHPSRSRVEEIHEDDQEEDEDDLEDDYDEEEEHDEEEDAELYTDDEFEDEETRAARADFFAFGNSLTVKDGILTVADDLLKNDGKHFIDMMEQLAERRMQREEDTQYNIAAAHQNFHADHNHGPLDDDYDDEEEEDDYDSEDEEEEFDEDEMDAMTEEQRMQEGRRMFQIFAARMFEQRVMTAYREKVAEQRQQQLLEELLEEENRTEQRNAKKAREAQKKKDKKRLQKQAKEEEKARRDAEKAAEEAAAKAAQEKKMEEQRLKREEQRKKREAERKAQEEERAKKEAEKQKRLKEERERQAEIERKQREQKEEKKRKEDAKRKEKEEREAREKKAKEESERKLREEHAKKEHDAAVKDGQEARVGSGKGVVVQTRPPIPNAVPAPAPAPATSVHPPLQSQHLPGLLKSPQASFNPPKVATSHETASAITTRLSLFISSFSDDILGVPPPTIDLARINDAPWRHWGQACFSSTSSSAPPSAFSSSIASGKSQPARLLETWRPACKPPPGCRQWADPGHGFPFPGMPAGFPMPQPGLSKPHSRQPSASFDRSPLDSSNQPFQFSRPSPMKQLSSDAQEQEAGHTPSQREVDSLSTQLGSSALLDDIDPQFPSTLSQSLPHGGIAPGQFPTPSRASFQGSSFFPDPLGPKSTNFAVGSSGWGAAPFGSTAFPSASTWGPTPASGWPHPQPHNVFAAGGHLRGHTSRPVTIRLLMIQACKHLNAVSPQSGSGGYHNVDVLLSQVEQLRASSEPAITLNEMLEICDTEGNHQNGGGQFSVKEEGSTRYVKFDPEPNSAVSGHRGSLVPGDIGSPVPGNSNPAAFGGFSTHSVLRQYTSPPAGMYGS
ncbi:hypothetical protein N7468_004386 [Penicillium chermesinum]|uniref:Stress response protein NST1 n=1 Tax=Penicillium chermesinum TaxID=63820 RepID=A0A9W9TSQ3_9EURO|nr:uncharacterized protein N7468_004386 [Penicillium chermesinum]KAJ5239767.1 hypothetical protein N7468_004386 [Penicillium chermesinum]